MSEELLTYGELKLRLKRPIDQKFITYKTQGGAKIAFVNITDIKDLLDERINPNHWEAIVKSTIVAGETLLMVVSLIIHAEDGVYCQDGTGIEKTTLKGYGDLGSNSYAQGLRRAAESHGLGRELWRMELSDEQKEMVRENSKPPLAERIKNISKAIVDLGGRVPPKIAGVSDNEYFEGLIEIWNELK